GDEVEGEFLRAKLRQSGVSLGEIEIIKNGKTGRAVISIGQNGDVSICADRGANRALTGRALTTIAETDLLYLTSVPDPVVDHILALVDCAKCDDTCFAYNPGLSQIRSCQPTFMRLLAQANILFMNA